jgi:hypothetical protein
MNKPVLEPLSTISTTLLALESLRANETERALEILEIQLDAAILTANRIASGMDSAERETINSLLQRTRDYRRVYPRRTEAELNDLASGLLVRSARAGQARAAKILDELE